MVSLRKLNSNVSGSVAIALISVLVFGGVLMLVDSLVVSADPTLQAYSPEEISYIASDEYLEHNTTHDFLVRVILNNKAKSGELNTVADSGWLGFFTLDLRMFKDLDWLGIAIRTIYSSCVFALTALFIAEILPFYVVYK